MGNEYLCQLAISNGLSEELASSFNDRQLWLYLSLQEEKNRALKERVSPDQITQLRVPANANNDAILSALRHALIVKQMSWEDACAKVNSAYKSSAPSLSFMAKNLSSQGDPLLRSWVAREEVKAKLSLSDGELGDDCAWFGADSFTCQLQQKALEDLIHKQFMLSAQAVRALQPLVKSHALKAVIVGTDPQVAKQMSQFECEIVHETKGKISAAQVRELNIFDKLVLSNEEQLQQDVLVALVNDDYSFEQARDIITNPEKMAKVELLLPYMELIPHKGVYCRFTPESYGALKKDNPVDKNYASTHRLVM